MLEVDTTAIGDSMGKMVADVSTQFSAPLAVDLGAPARIVTDEHAAAPGAVVAAAVRRGDAFRLGAGWSGRLEPEGAAVRLDTPYDIASVTKPVVALALARLERARVLSRVEPLVELLPAIAGTPSADVPLDLLLSHRAGLDGHRPLFAPLTRGERVDAEAALREAASARRAGCDGAPPEVGFPPVYSDLGYLLVGAAMSARAGLPLDRIVEAEVSGPLALAIRSARAWEATAPDRFHAVAPTELAAWRGGVVRGRVHDENAFAVAGDAMCGHAGLFGDAPSVARLGIAILDALAGRSAWLSPRDLEPLVRDRPGGSLRAGFDGRSGDSPSCGARFGPRTFGHLGFTGTSLWIDPDAELVGVLLTNRVYPTRDHIAIRAARPAVYDAIAQAMGG